MRPSINIPRQQVIDLNGFFGLHPSLSSFKPLWDQRQLAIVHAAGSPDTTRSHFDAQDYMESGTPGVKITSDGWLNRTLQSEPAAADSPFRGIALGTSLPRILSGKASAVAVSNVNGFSIAEEIRLLRRWAIPLKPCMSSQWTACYTAPGGRHLKR